MILIRPVNITETILTSTNADPSPESEWLVGTTYNTGDKVKRTAVSDINSVYVSLKDSNTGNPPEDDDLVNPVNWARESATNPWAMFSDQISDQTEQATSIIVELTPGEVVNGISFFNLDASMVQVVMDDPIEGEVYNNTINLVDGSGVNNWYEWYFEPISLQDTLALLDLPPFVDAVITVTITKTGGTAKCGLLTIGSQKKLGDSEYGTNVGIIDYSRKERDTFGNPVIVQRNFSKRVNYIVAVDTSAVNVALVTLANFRTTPLTYIGDVNHPATIVYGYYRDFSEVIRNPSKSTMSLEVEGLT